MSNITTGLRQRPTYNELIKEIVVDKKIDLPNRQAKFLRDSPYLSFLDNVTLAEVEDQQLKVQKQIQTEHAIREQASQTNQTASELRARQAIKDSATQVDSLMVASSSSSSSSQQQQQQQQGDIDMLPTTPIHEWLPDLTIQLPDLMSRTIRDDDDNKQIKDDQMQDLADLPSPEIIISHSMDSSIGQQKRSEKSDLEEASPRAKSRVSATPASASVSTVDAAVPAGDTPVTDTVLPYRLRLTAEKSGRMTPLSADEKEYLKMKKDQGASKEELASLRATIMSRKPEHTTASSSAASSSTTPQQAQQQPTAPADATQDEAGSVTKKPKTKDDKTPVIKTQFDKKQRFVHGTKLDTSHSKSHWDKKNIAYIIDQLQLRNVRFTPEQLKGKNRLRKHNLIDMIMNTPVP